MNSTKILFLKMLRGDIKRNACEKMGIDPSEIVGKEELLAGQTVKRSGIVSFPSYKMMNDDERACVDSIMDELVKKNNEVGSEKGKALLKQIDSLVPSSSLSDAIEYKDAA